MKPFFELPPPGDSKALKRTVGLLSHYSKWISSFSEKIRPLINSHDFPLKKDAIEAFECLKREISQASLHAIQDQVPFVVETDASSETIAALLSQNDRPVAFFTRTLNASDKLHSCLEKVWKPEL